MDENQIKTIVTVLFLSVFGGLINMLRQNSKYGRERTFFETVGKTVLDLMIASFAGLLTYWFFARNGGEMTNTMCASVSMAGYLGGKAIDMFTAIWQSKFPTPDKK